MIPTIHVGVQGGFLETVTPPAGILGDVFTIHGSGVECNANDTHAQFIGYSQASIQTSLTNYLGNNGITDLTDARTFILDMEGPNNGTTTFAHPGNLNEASASQQDEIVIAWKTRIAAARAVLPNAKIGMYGTIIPNGRGNETDGYIAQRAAMLEAAAEGLFTGLDWLVPVLYPRFGPDDPTGAWTSMPAMTRQGVDDSRLLADLPLLPLITYAVYNASSANDGDIVLDWGIGSGLYQTLLGQVSVFAGRNVADVCLWVPAAADTYGPLPSPNVGGWTLSDFLVRLMPTTTFDTVRTQMVSLLEALTPTSQAGVKFRHHRDEVEFFDWCATNKAAAFRRIEVHGGTTYEGPEVTNTDVEFHRTSAQVTVAYPMEWGKYGLKNRASLDKVIEEDMHQIDDAIGLRGQANWVGSQFAIKVRDEIAEQDGVLFLRLHFEVGFYRSV